MIILTTRSYPPEIGGMQSLIGGLAIHLHKLHPIKVLADSSTGDENYDKKNNFETKRIGGFKILKKYRKLSQSIRKQRFCISSNYRLSWRNYGHIHEQWSCTRSLLG